MTDRRNPHLPPPEVVDWLLAQEWGQPIDISSKHSFVSASAALGRDHIIELMLEANGLELLRADQQQRQASPTADICADDAVWTISSITAHSIVINGRPFRLVPEAFRFVP